MRRSNARLLVSVLLALVCAAGVACGGSEGSAESTTSAPLTEADCGPGLVLRDGRCEPLTTSSSTTPSRAQIGEQIATAVDPQRKLDVLHSDYERIAEIASAFCSDLEAGSRPVAEAELERAMFGLVFLRQNSIDDDPTPARLSGELLAGMIDDVAVERLCPDFAEDRFLPPS
jgi:hypothetical protein